VLGRTLVIGRRTNVLLRNRTLLYLPDHVTAAARQRGQLYAENAEDYFFIAFNDFPWHRVVDVVIGRPAYDNYLVGLAIRQNVTVVDATSTLLALHQTGSDGNMAGHMNRDSGFNAAVIGKFNYNSGLSSSAQYESKLSVDYDHNTTKVVVVKRPRPAGDRVVHGRVRGRHVGGQVQGHGHGSLRPRLKPRPKPRLPVLKAKAKADDQKQPQV